VSGDIMLEPCQHYYQWHHRVDDLEALKANLIENNKIKMTQVEIISIFLG
jgi:hypothetical protein